MADPLLKATNISREFWSHFLFRKLHLFRGPQDVETVVSDFIEEETAIREQDAKAKGAAESAELTEKIGSTVVVLADDYLSLILKIGEFAYEEAGKEFTDEELRIVQVRTDFDFHSWLVRVLFLIDADPAIEPRFCQVLAEIEKGVLLQERFVAQLLCMNKRDREIDSESIRENYPFVAKVRREP